MMWPRRRRRSASPGPVHEVPAFEVAVFRCSISCCRAGDGELLLAVGAICDPRPACASSWSTRSRPWSRTTGACARSRRATGACSTWSAMRAGLDALSSGAGGQSAGKRYARPMTRACSEAPSRAASTRRERGQESAQGDSLRGPRAAANLLLADGETRVDLSAASCARAARSVTCCALPQRSERAERATAVASICRRCCAPRRTRSAADRWTAASWPSTRQLPVLAQLVARSRHRALRGSLAGAQRRGPERAALQSARATRGQAVLFDADARGGNAGAGGGVRLPPRGARCAGLCAVHPRCRAPAYGREHPVAAKLPSSIEQVTQRVGRVPLKELVRESTDLIEALCIETALEVTRTTALPRRSCWVSAASRCTPSCGAYSTSAATAPSARTDLPQGNPAKSVN
jgi:hypothetical protein